MQNSSVDRNQLSPVSESAIRYEQPPLYPFRSLREANAEQLTQNQTQNQTVRTNNSAARDQQTQIDEASLPDWTEIPGSSRGNSEQRSSEDNSRTDQAEKNENWRQDFSFLLSN